MTATPKQKQCAQCGKAYRSGPVTVGCPKCAKGVVISEQEFRESIKMKTKVEIIESEAGWDPKLDEVKEFDSYDEAMKFVKDYNTKHNPPATFTPTWYMYARVEGDDTWGMRRHD